MIKILLRKSKDKSLINPLFAIFPYETNGAYCTFYDVVGGHNEGYYFFAMQESTPANKEESEEILQSLYSTGYVPKELQVIKRTNHKQ